MKDTLPGHPLQWRVGDDRERIAVALDQDECTARYVTDPGDGRPTSIQRMTGPAQPPRRWRLIACPCCGRNLGLSEWDDGRWRVEPHVEEKP